MAESLSDFHARLYSIRPFTETLSPPASPSHAQMPRPPLEDPLQDMQVRRVVSDGRQGLGGSSYKTITSISSTIDMLFSKIEKIKEEFSYALDKPQPDSEIPPQTIPHFYSQRQIQHEPHKHTHSLQNIPTENNCNKENSSNGQPRQQQANKGDSHLHTKLMHSLSLPLQEHNSNTPKREYSSHPLEYKQNIPPTNDLFQAFLPEPSPSHIKIGDFQLGRRIGSGKFGDVYLSIHRSTGFLCAIKKILKSTIRQYGMEGQLAVELRLHYSVSHPNVVQLYGHFDDEYHIFLLMEYACDGALIDHLRAPQPQAASAVSQVVRAVEALHQRNIVHRDIKPENIVCSLGVAKLCDFGWAAVLDHSHMRRTFCGTLDYVSPEMKDVGEYNHSVDLWSIGVLTFELLAGFPPYKHQIAHWRLCGSQRKQKWNWEVIYPPEISHYAQKFIQGLLKEIPSERTTLQECLCAPFLSRAGYEGDPLLQSEFQF